MAAVPLPWGIHADDEADDMNHHIDLHRLDFAALLREEGRLRLTLIDDRHRVRALLNRLSAVEALLQRGGVR